MRGIFKASVLAAGLATALLGTAQAATAVGSDADVMWGGHVRLTDDATGVLVFTVQNVGSGTTIQPTVVKAAFTVSFTVEVLPSSCKTSGARTLICTREALKSGEVWHEDITLRFAKVTKTATAEVSMRSDRGSSMQQVYLHNDGVPVFFGRMNV